MPKAKNFVPISKYTNGPRKLYCPQCKLPTQFGSMSWSETICPRCGKTVAKANWLVTERRKSATKEAVEN